MKAFQFDPNNFQLGSENNGRFGNINISSTMMDKGGNFYLNNTEFETKTVTVLRSLHANNKFTDVTLACEDGKQLRAHKIILSSASVVFDKILMEYSDSNPLIYFGDTSYEHIEYIIRFVYLGEVSVPETELQPFMETVSKFKINGLYSEEPKHGAYLQNISANTNYAKEEDANEKPFDEDSKMDIVDLKSSGYSCDKCKYKTTTKEYLRIHRRSIHDGIKYPCDKCDYKATQSSSLWQHNKSVHEGIKYPCDQCDYKANRPARLNSHIRETHDGIKYPCDKCDHKETTRLRLNLHVKGVHEGVSHSCNQCEYRTLQRRYLKKHQEMLHFGLRFHCDVDSCDYSAVNSDRLRKHRSKEHAEQIKTEFDLSEST